MDETKIYTVLAYNGERTLLYYKVSESEIPLVEDDVKRAGAVIISKFASTDADGNSYEKLRKVVTPSRRCFK